MALLPKFRLTYDTVHSLMDVIERLLKKVRPKDKVEGKGAAGATPLCNTAY
jgi:hypothetical protein